ncbi:ESX secretion-associated protein EspG [Nocardia sp. NPDC004722]
MNDDPVAVDLNVDAALVLATMVGIDAYPPVLALMPNIYRLDDRDRVHAVVAAQLEEAGVLDGGHVHPVVQHWLRCLSRPDVELVVRIVEPGPDPKHGKMLRLTLVRRGDTHVLAVRCDDHVTVQQVFTEGDRIEHLTAALLSALGPADVPVFEPFTATAEQLATVPAEPGDRRRALLELAASPQTASLLTRAMDEVIRRAEVLMTEHRDGVIAVPDLCVSVLDTSGGRIAALPARALDGQLRTTFLPGDETALHAGIRALVDLLPGASWHAPSRS